MVFISQETLLRQVSNLTSEILDHQYWASILTRDGKRPKIGAPANQTSVLCFYGLGHVTCGRKSFCVCFPSHSGRGEFYSSKWLPDAQKDVFGLSRDTVHSLTSCPPSPSPRPLTLWDVLISLHKLSMQLNHVMSAETLAVLSSHGGPVLD